MALRYLEFKLPQNWAGLPQSVPSGEGGVDGDGDITRPENINAFRNFILDNTDRKGVHFLMADGVGDCPCKDALRLCCEFRGLFLVCCSGVLVLGILSKCVASEPYCPLRNTLVLFFSCHHKW